MVHCSNTDSASSLRLTRKDINRIYDSIIDHYGMSRYTDFIPDLDIIKDREDDLMGEYCQYTETIMINMAHHDDIRTVTETLIHEYMHYLQPHTGQYDRMLKKYGYDSHPYELVAEASASRDVDLILNLITA